MLWNDSEMSPDSRGPDFIQSLARGLDILEFLGENGGEASVADVAEHTGLNRATARRLLITLEQLGYLSRTSRSYQLTPRVLQLGYRYLAGVGISDLVSKNLDELAASLGEAVSLTVRDGDEIVYVARARLDKVMTIALSVGARLPVWTTSMGRVLLSSLGNQEIRELYAHSREPQPATAHTKTSLEDVLSEVNGVRGSGFCLVDQELEWGLRSVAVPVLRSGEVFAALNVATANVSEQLADTRDRVLPALQKTAREISNILQATPLHLHPVAGER